MFSQWGIQASSIQRLALRERLIRHLISARYFHGIDMSSPHTWYPEARRIQRKIVCHIGPTNSGKTYNALQVLQGASRGVYCGPLRLLAWEICNYLRDRNVRCDLITGQEIDRGDDSTHTCCTIEMTSLSGHAAGYDVAVLDEFQMIGDERRGWAWCRAFLGLQAEEIHVCG